jgi:nucleotide-binding universal stress UspA family protein
VLEHAVEVERDERPWFLAHARAWLEGRSREQIVMARPLDGDGVTRIVVGVDGSEQALRALRWAVEEARGRDAALAVVHVVPRPVNLADPILLPPPPEHDLEARGLEVIDQALAQVETDDLEVERAVVPGHAAWALCEAATDADLLVVGARGLGGFRGLLVGSVTHQVVAHAPCPVVVVVPETRPHP